MLVHRVALTPLIFGELIEHLKPIQHWRKGDTGMRDIMDLSSFREFPSAHHFGVYKCQSCPNAHVVLFDEESTPIAEMTVSWDLLETFDLLVSEVLQAAL
jgi:hypothetical protein